jgi:hypothetical protein
MNTLRIKLDLLAILAVGLGVPCPSHGQGAEFTYQGRVTDDGTNFNGIGQFKFALLTPTNTSSQATAGYVSMLGLLYDLSVYSISVANGGSGYTTAPTVTLSPADGVGGPTATAVATISNGVVTAITVVNPGGGYYLPPQVTISPPPADYVNAPLWANDGADNGEPALGVTAGVANGLFTVVLGDTNLPNMTAIPPSVLTQPTLLLQIWFNDGVNGFAALAPVQPLTPSPQAVFAGTAANLLGSLPTSQLTGTFSGNGSGLTSLVAANLTGAVPASLLTSVPAAKLTGTLSTQVLPTPLGLPGALGIDQTGAYGQNTGTVRTDALTFGTGPGGSGEGIASQRTSGANQFDLAFYTGFDARLTILASGNVGIGTPSPDALLTVNGNVDKPGGGSWGTFSDERLKDVGANFTPGLEALGNIQPVHYHYKSDNPLKLPSSPDYVGVVAQQVQSAIPEAVERNQDGYLVVNNDPILWTMFNAIKELNQELNQQREAEQEAKDAEIQTLKRQNDALTRRLTELEATVRGLSRPPETLPPGPRSIAP